jgi:nicotinate phosphoribosyltransferase
MGNVAYCQFPDMHVKYKFKLRNKGGVDWTLKERMEILNELEKWCSLSFTKEEIAYLDGQNLFDRSYLEFLTKYSPNIDHLNFDAPGDPNDLNIEVEGPWCQTIFWELAVLPIVNEVYFRRYSSSGKPPHSADVEIALLDKIAIANRARMWWADFGTRRRFSRRHQEMCVKTAMEGSQTFVGTSNVALAMKYDVRPIGTMAHEYLQIGQAITHPLDAQGEMLQRWCDQYRGNLGIALTDIVGVDAFLKDFDLYFANVYDGVRHDSGDPYWWADKIITHYRNLGIDPKTKTLVFSDGLNFSLAAAIHDRYKDVINTSFGIGTNFTNDIPGLTPLQIVMKIVEVNGRPVAKISDSPGKGMCEDEEYIKYLMSVHNIGIVS